MASITCADSREGIARAMRTRWGDVAGRSIGRAVDRARRWLRHCRTPSASADQACALPGEPRETQLEAVAVATLAGESAPADPAPARPVVETVHALAFAHLLAHVSHELRTPLNAVIGFSDVMQQELFGPLGDSRYQEYVRHIRDSGDALLRAAEDTLAMTTLVASASHANPDRVDLSALLIGAWCEVLRRTAARGVRLELEIAPALEIRADARAMRQALKHLLAAALARTPTGGTVRVAAVTAHGRVRIELLVPEAHPAHPASPDALEPVREGLAVSIARALLELQGSALTEQRGGHGWMARTELEHAVQEDFFARAP